MKIFMQYSGAERTAQKLEFPGKNAGKNARKTLIAMQCICAGRKPAKGRGRVERDTEKMSQREGKSSSEWEKGEQEHNIPADRCR